MQDIKIGNRVYKGVHKIKAFDEKGNEIPFFDVSQSEVTKETLVKGAHGYDKDGNLVEGTYEPQLEELTATANGGYVSSKDGFSKVTVDVKQEGGAVPSSYAAAVKNSACSSAGPVSATLTIKE